MKKKIQLILIIIIMFSSYASYAKINNAGYEGGIYKNESDYNDKKEYKEVIFITGEPIKLYGTVEIDIDDESIEYDYELSSRDGNVTLEREIEIERIIDNSSKVQTVEVNNILDYDETIEASGSPNTTYTLKNYQFHNSTIDDNQPVIAFYSGDWEGTKVYDINSGEGEIRVEVTGGIYGYDNHWGDTETQKIHKDITYRTQDEDVSNEWFGFVDIDVSNNRTKDMKYSDNLPYQTSFDGSYTMTEKEETIMTCSYDLPYFSSGTTLANVRNQGEDVQRFETLPTRQKLYIPKYEDIKGHWAEEDIKKLSGLKIIDSENKYFGPEYFTTRKEFAKSIAIAMNMTKEEAERSYSYPKPPLFSDVLDGNPYYDYIKVMKEKGIMDGTGGGKFSPDKNLTRQEAITIMIRSLGIENLAPNPPFITRFNDDEDIACWSKKSIYVADQIGLAEGSEGYIYPEDFMTKAESATFINRFINYLQNELKKDYRERIINNK